MVQALPVGPLVVYLSDRPPSPSDDAVTIRARRGYWWADRSDAAFWLCVDPAEGAAVWHRLGNAEDLAPLAWSASWEDLQHRPETLAGYGILDAATAEDLEAHAQAKDNPHEVTAAQVGADPEGAAAAAEGAAKSYSDGRLLALTNSLKSAAYQDASAFDPAGAAAAAESNAIGYTQGALGDLGSAAQHPAEDFAPAASVALLPVVLAGPDSLQPADEGCLVLSEGHAVSLPDSGAPGMYDGWRCVIKNTAGAELAGWGHLGPALTLQAVGGDQIDGRASLRLAAGAAALVVRIAPGHYAIT